MELASFYTHIKCLFFKDYILNVAVTSSMKFDLIIKCNKLTMLWVVRALLSRNIKYKLNLN